MTNESEERLVELHVYDLSRGLAKQLSLGFLGIQIDAVYHTSIVVGGKEYYYGHGIQSSLPGQTHHGAPIEIVPLGPTSLPDSVFLEYLDSLKPIYSIEAYDLFTHNCNNFTNDVAQFLTGHGIPDHITSLPSTVLATPFGQMIKPMIEQSLRPVTTAPSAPPAPSSSSVSMVKVANSLVNLEELLASARDSCAVVFFTSATCPPCRIMYPHFEQLATHAGAKGVFVKVDAGTARDAGSKFQVSATPTFITFMNGEQVDRWSGASASDLRSKVDILLRMAHPPHPHMNLSLQTTLGQSMKPIIFSKIPPLDKVLAKLGSTAQEPPVQHLEQFLDVKSAKGAVDAPLPNLGPYAELLREHLATQSSDLFPLVDLLRAALADPRVSGWFAEEKDQRTFGALLSYVTSSHDIPYALHLVTLQALCNVFTSPLFPRHLMSQLLSTPLLSFIASSLLDQDHTNSRSAASSLAFNIATYVQKERSKSCTEVLAESELVELVVGILESLKKEAGSREVVRALVLSLALLVYCAPIGSELGDVLSVLEAGAVVKGKASGQGLGDKVLCAEVGTLLEA